MTDSTDKDPKKVHLIKQAKQASQEQPIEPVAAPQPDQGTEKKKVVVVVKKKVVTAKKVQAKVISPAGSAQGGAQEETNKEPAASASAQVEAHAKLEIARPTPESSAHIASHKGQEPGVSAGAVASLATQESSGKSEESSAEKKAAETKPDAPRSPAHTSPSQQSHRPDSSYNPQRRYSSDGRAGNLAQGRPAPTSRYNQDRNESRPPAGTYPTRTSYGQQPSRSYPSTQTRPGQGSPSAYNRGPRPSGGSQYPGSSQYPGAPGGANRGYPSARSGQQPGSRPGGYAGSRPSGAGGYGGSRPGGSGGYGARPAPAPAGENRPSTRRQPAKKKGTFGKREEEIELEKQIQLKKKAEAKLAAVPKSVDIMENISISDLAKKMNLKPADLISKLMSLGVMATINQKIDADTAAILAAEYGCEVRVVSLYDETVIEKAADKPEELKPRPPIVTVMGHVDHGKTKLLDAIRKTDVVSQEFGGITQHIGAYMVDTPRGKISFLDTPGHAAFTKMRARGANLTDIVILVVSAVEGVMPQTKEAIDHAKAADVPIIVAINKIDLPEANPDRVKTQLSELGLIPEEWGGTTQFVEVSALQKKGIPELFDAILLQAEMLDLKANFDRLAEGKVIESRIDQGRGIVSSIMIQNGTLRIGDPFVAGIYPGKVRALFDDKGQRVEEATPAMPVEVLGFEGMPEAGDPFEAVEDEKFARQISAKRQELKKYEEGRNVKKVTLDNLYETISQGEIKELKVIIKGDVHGSVEALKGMLEKLSTSEVHLNVIRAAAGAITEDDVMMASASNAIIIGFNVRPTPSAKQLAEREKVDVRKYNIIYRAQEEIKLAMEGLLAPELKEQEVGKAEVRSIFRVPKVGIVAGCQVTEGIVKRNCQVRVIRDNIEIFQGSLSSLKRFKDDVKEVAAGYECGIGIENCNDLQEGDILEFYETVEVARTLESGNNNGSDTKASS
ncbi:translation initiation factor IF-2 [Rectinema subterraneum]|uniref:translation initiation factor IF-2 n=1 Tax=Rectinema subterraneum TaxID=2653714 RepID=UPI00131ADD08|nr:translation initiation factor IF-2 [Rectinema subterraneum]